MHYRDTINQDGTFNFRAIMLIASANARRDRSSPYRQVIARELRTVWRVAQGMRGMHQAAA